MMPPSTTPAAGEARRHLEDHGYGLGLFAGEKLPRVAVVVDHLHLLSACSYGGRSRRAKFDSCSGGVGSGPMSS